MHLGTPILNVLYQVPWKTSFLFSLKGEMEVGGELIRKFWGTSILFVDDTYCSYIDEKEKCTQIYEEAK